MGSTPNRPAGLARGFIFATAVAVGCGAAIGIAPEARAQSPAPAVRLAPPPRVENPDQLLPTKPRTKSGGLMVDATSRQAVIDFYNAQYVTALDSQINWTGSVATCTPGTIAAAFADDAIQMFNYFRAMAGLPGDVTRLSSWDVDAQAAALIMAANNNLSHSVPINWTCYSATGATGASRSNLSLGTKGAQAVNGYMQDPGNPAVGHRRWILYPPQSVVGTGSTSASNYGASDALLVIGDFTTRPASPEIVPWPPKGFVPYALISDYWSFSVNQPSQNVDFSGATITMKRGGTTVPVTKLTEDIGYGDDTITWTATGIVAQSGMADTTYTITISNAIVNGSTKSYMYDVTIIDPAVVPTPTPTPSPSPTPTRSPSPSPSASRTPSPSLTPSSSLSPSASPTPSPSATPMPNALQQRIIRYLLGQGSYAADLDVNLDGRVDVADVIAAH